MRTIYQGRGRILYQPDRGDREREAALVLARRQARTLTDSEAAEVGALFPEWEPGRAYTAGERISDREGRLYRVAQDHVSQADWPMDQVTALYVPLGTTAEEPEAVPEWRQPTGGHDAYQTGDRVLYQGKLYESTMDGNVWAPDTYGWREIER